MTGVTAINNIRMCPANMVSGSKTAKVNGRTYSCTVGSTIDVPEFDAQALEAAGFLNMGTSGPTTQRPAYPPNATSEARVSGVPFGARMIDTTLNVAAVFTGAVWVNAATGAVV